MALAIEPENAKFHYILAAINYKLGQNNAAISSLTKAAEDWEWHERAMQNIQIIKLKKMYSLPHFEKLGHPPKQIQILSKHEAYNPLFYENSQIIIYSKDTQTYRFSAHRYDIKKDK